MPAIVAIPQVEEEVVIQFGNLSPNEPSRQYFAEYITPLLVAEHKTIGEIAHEFAVLPDKSCLSRWLAQTPWESERINVHHLDWLQQDPSTCYRRDGVIVIDNTLIEDIG